MSDNSSSSSSSEAYPDLNVLRATYLRAVTAVNELALLDDVEVAVTNVNIAVEVTNDDPSVRNRINGSADILRIAKLAVMRIVESGDLLGAMIDIADEEKTAKYANYQHALHDEGTSSLSSSSSSSSSQSSHSNNSSSPST